jgi:hypothetical protein
MFKKIAQRLLDHLAAGIAARIKARPDERMLQLLGREFALRVRGLPANTPIRDVEFRVYSQFGEDGIIQFLLAHADVRSRIFVEFGVQNYVESNTRFLLLNDNWSGLVLDSSKKFIDFIRSDAIFWRHDLATECAFITRENIDELIGRHFEGEIGLLSIDIDGNDYWVWDAIDCVTPDIVVCEYNSIFGGDRAVTVPYRPDFDRAVAHHSYLYFGASLPALSRLGAAKGYELVASNAAGVNAFFVRRDRLGALRGVGAARAYVESKFRESRDKSGRMNHLAGRARLREIQDLPLLDLESGHVRPIRELYAAELAA